ncbi:hypothetical protein GOODEAATRI_033103 [Goodea atripinnis]|uniref:Uncharacterized protein n=1 Tax=Goodea atripinnis TaxID=208336 RepID=A0ABV0PJ15_9TELE
MHPGPPGPLTLATCPPGPKPPGPSQDHSLGATHPRNPRAHPRRTQEQNGQQANNLCLPALAPQKRRMQPPDVTPESHQSLTLVGPQSPVPGPPVIATQGQPRCPKPRYPPISATTPHRTEPKVSHPD